MPHETRERYHSSLLELSRQKMDRWELFLSCVLRHTTEVLGVDLASFWSISQDWSTLTCEEVYFQGGERTTCGDVLHASSCPKYFEALRIKSTVSIDDLSVDPIGDELAEYTQRWNVQALLDVAVHIGQKVVGILCLEAQGHPRHWNEDDRSYAAGLASILSLAYQTAARVKDQKKISEYARQLETQNRELERFTYAASHDLRAPLRTVIGFTELLKQSLANGNLEKADHYLDRILCSAQFLAELIDDLLAYSKLSGQIINRKKVDLTNLVKENFGRLPHEDVELTMNGPIPANCEPKLVSQLLQNLLDNAIKYNVSHPKTVRFGRHIGASGKPFYFIEDNGIGISEQDRQRVFEPFVRLHPRSHFEGTGIGLALCQRIVELHHGQIWIEPSALGGSRIVFTLGENHAS